MSKSTLGIGWGHMLARLGVAILATILPVFGLSLLLCSPLVPLFLPRSEVLPGSIRNGIVITLSAIVGFLLLRVTVRLTSWLAEGPTIIRPTSHQGLARSARSDPLWDPMLDD